jgi:hypothetical protein
LLELCGDLFCEMQKVIKLGASVLFAAGTIVLANVSPAQAACTGAGNTLPGGGTGGLFTAFTLGNTYDAGNGFCFTLNSFSAGLASATLSGFGSVPDGIGF